MFHRAGQVDSFAPVVMPPAGPGPTRRRVHLAGRGARRRGAVDQYHRGWLCGSWRWRQ